MTETVVRLAQPEDEDGLVELCHLLHEENGLFPLSEPKVRALVKRATDRQGGIIGVIGDPGQPVAGIQLAIDQMYYSDQWFLNEGFNFVRPDHRKSDFAVRLIEYAEMCSDRMRLPLMMGLLTNHRTEQKIRLYERRRLEKAGAYFVYGRQYAGPGAWDR